MIWLCKEFFLIIFIISSVYSANIIIQRGNPCTTPNGNSGVCTFLSDCASLKQDAIDGILKTADLRKYRCTIEGNLEVYCCASDKISIKFETKSQPEPTNENRKAKKACDFYLSNKADLLEAQVLGGTEASIKSYSHMCSLRYPSDTDLSCGGSLISDRWVLTAAHCEIKAVTHVFLGRDDLIEPGGLEVPVEEGIVHENYDKNKKHNDIALLKLSRAVEFSEKVYPACLYIDNDPDTNGPAEGTNVTITGFGKHDNLKSAGHVLLKGNLQISSFAKCSAIYRNESYDIISSQICANGTQDSCQGDSGGPLQILIEEQKQISAIVGVISYGLLCGKADGVYTRVSSYLDWIEERVWSD